MLRVLHQNDVRFAVLTIQYTRLQQYIVPSLMCLYLCVDIFHIIVTNFTHFLHSRFLPRKLDDTTKNKNKAPLQHATENILPSTEKKKQLTSSGICSTVVILQLCHVQLTVIKPIFKYTVWPKECGHLSITPIRAC